LTLDAFPDPHSKYGSGSRRAKMAHKKKVKNFHGVGYSLFRVEGFSCSWASFMEA
jgi:hypothetical protein